MKSQSSSEEVEGGRREGQRHRDVRMEADTERCYFAVSEDGARGPQAKAWSLEAEKARKHFSPEPPERNTALPIP